MKKSIKGKGGGRRVDRRRGHTFIGLVAMRVTTSMTAWSVQPSLSAFRLCAMEPAVVTSMPMSCTHHCTAVHAVTICAVLNDQIKLSVQGTAAACCQQKARVRASVM